MKNEGMHNVQSSTKTFVTVADCGSFNKAAEELYISPPSVMKQLNALEKHLDLKLLDRTNQGTADRRGTGHLPLCEGIF